MSNTNNTVAKSNRFNANTIIGLGLLTAIVVVMQFISMGLRFGTFSITLTLIPIVVGAALYGWVSGAWLGFVFGVSVLLTGDANAFLAVNIPGTITTVLVKGILAGLCAGLVYELISKKNQIAAVLVSAVIAPVVNTGIFILGSYVFFFDYLSGLAEGTNLFVFILVALVGINFFIELGTNLVLNPAILQIIRIGKKMKSSK
ncbi:MAG: ECF transporter S component [Ruminiclostridium sp.]|nr:ECF transporter S component [Ruminiclostridium sp.]